jgi:ribonuclease PH
LLLRKKELAKGFYKNLMRSDGRRTDELRKVVITPNYLVHPAGSCLIEMGSTRVICSAMLEETVPHFIKGQGKGWLTAEYSMLPACSQQRVQRERAKVGGRTHEIQRLIGRSLRSCVDLSLLGERTILVDCDVVDADGGTRTASITGAYVAVALALKKLSNQVPGAMSALKSAVAAISVGIVHGKPCLDLNYVEDKDAEVDMNVVRTSLNKFVEVQGTAEGVPFDESALQDLLALGKKGILELFEFQKRAIQS